MTKGDVWICVSLMSPDVSEKRCCFLIADAELASIQQWDWNEPQMNGGPGRDPYLAGWYIDVWTYTGVVINCRGASVDIGAASTAGVGPVKGAEKKGNMCQGRVLVGLPKAAS